ncbi:unnamed protein product [Thelazia callipaeda]|uniref:Serine/threonine-protein phosphatase n=1 Tax=Thelazia callipaeda TaxID=103827 RepID=A0A0N5D7J9_THECL|nr:unnamed protein product [Thelazia callipaeda]
MMMIDYLSMFHTWRRLIPSEAEPVSLDESPGSQDESPDGANQASTPPSSEQSDSRSSREEDSEDDLPPPVVFNHPLVNSLLDRFMRAQLQPDKNSTTVNMASTITSVPSTSNIGHSRNNLAGKKLFFHKILRPAPIHVVDLKFDELRQLCELAINSFSKQRPLLRIGNEMLPITICADTHGQFRDVRCILSTCGNPLLRTYLFLGDYVDRGSQACISGIETVTMLLCFKIKYPTRVYMLRGNHEDANTTLTYGFFDECTSRFPNDQGELLWHIFMMVFNMMPLAAIVSERILCMHGGLSPHLKDINMLDNVRSSLMKVACLNDLNHFCWLACNLPRPSIVPPYGLMCDTLWSDPDDRYPGWALSARGISFTFSSKIIREFCEANDIDLIVRGHQLTADMFKGGYKYFAGGRLVTIFSAPNYLNMRNDSCVLHISRKVKSSLQ